MRAVSKQWQDALTVVLLASGFVFTIVWMMRMLFSNRASDEAKTLAVAVIFIYCIAIPAFLIGSGLGIEDAWRTLRAPFVAGAR